METFGQEIKKKASFPESKTISLRYDLIREELEELKDALDKKDIKEVADALTDILYVFAVFHFLHIWSEVLVIPPFALLLWFLQVLLLPALLVTALIYFNLTILHRLLMKLINQKVSLLILVHAFRLLFNAFLLKEFLLPFLSHSQAGLLQVWLDASLTMATPFFFVHHPENVCAPTLEGILPNKVDPLRLRCDHFPWLFRSLSLHGIFRSQVLLVRHIQLRVPAG